MPDNKEELDRNQAEASARATKTTNQLADALQDLIERNKSVGARFDKLNKELETGRKRFVDIGPALDSLRESIEEMEEGTEKAKRMRQLEEKENRAIEAETRRRKIDSAMELAKGLASAGVNITKSVISSYQSNASAFSTSGDVLTTALDSANQTVKGMAGVANTAASGLMFLGPKGVAAGIALSSLAVAATAVFEKFTELSKFAINVAVRELEKTSQSFAQLSSAGALFTNGLTELRNTAALAGLTQEEFAKVVSANNIILSQFGGNVGIGARVMANVTKALGTGPGSLRDGLLSLGYSVEDIAEGTAAYMEIQAAQGRAERRDYANLARETDAYLTNLRMITAFTGEDAKKAQARAREAATQTAVSARLRTMSAAGDLKAQARFRAAISNLPDALSSAVSQMFVSDGNITDSDLAVAIYNNAEALEVSRRVLGYINDASIDDVELTRRLQADQKLFGDAIVKNADSLGMSTGVANRLIGSFSGIETANKQIQEFGLKKQLPGEKSAAETTADLKTTQDALTKSYREAIDVNQQLKIAIQTELTGAITDFAALTKNIIAELRDTLGYFTKKKTTGEGVNYGEAAVNMEGVPLITPEAPTPKAAPAKPSAAPTGPTSAVPAAGATVTATNLKIKPGFEAEKQQGGASIMEMARQVHAMLGGDYKYFSGFKDRGIDDSVAHGTGRAFDLVLNDMKQYPGVVAKLRAMPGFSKVLDESLGPANAKKKEDWGPHIHAEVAAAQGAIVPATTGGVNVKVAEGGASEVIAPLKNGRLPGMDEMIQRLDQMISVLKDQRDTSEKIFQATI